MKVGWKNVCCLALIVPIIRLIFSLREKRRDKYAGTHRWEKSPMVGIVGKTSEKRGRIEKRG